TGRVTCSSVEQLSLQHGQFNIDANLSGDGIDETGGDSALLLHTSQTLAALSLSSGAAATMDRNGSSILRAQSLSISGGGKLDLNDNDLIVSYFTNPGAFTTIRGYVFAGYSSTPDSS